MAKIRIKGIHKVKAKGNTYYYAWRGGPRLEGQPGTDAFMKPYGEAIEKRRIPDDGKFRALVTHYRSSPDYQNLRLVQRKTGLAGLTVSAPTSAT